MKPEMQKLIVEIPRSTMKDLKIRAIEVDKTLKEIVNEALERWLEAGKGGTTKTRK